MNSNQDNKKEWCGSLTLRQGSGVDVCWHAAAVRICGMVAGLNFDLVAGEVDQVGDDHELFGAGFEHHFLTLFFLRARSGGKVGQAGRRAREIRQGSVGHAN